MKLSVLFVLFQYTVQMIEAIITYLVQFYFGLKTPIQNRDWHVQRKHMQIETKIEETETSIRIKEKLTL